jgi:two-component system response regulator RegA
MSAPRAESGSILMPGRSGLELIGEIRRISPATTIVVLTADGSAQSKAEARRLGASAYLTKPTDADQIIATLVSATPA